MSVGIDRSAQVTVIVGGDANEIATNLNAAEELLARVDLAGCYARRRWVIGETADDGGLIVPIVPERSRRNTIQGIVDTHFSLAADDRLPAIAFVLPGDAAPDFVAGFPRCVLGARAVSAGAIPVTAVERSSSAALRGPAAERDLAQMIEKTNFIEREKYGLDELKKQRVKGLRWLVRWFAENKPGDFQAFLRVADIGVVRSCFLSGRIFGADGKEIHESESQLAEALIDASRRNAMLLLAIGSLPVTERTLRALIASAPGTRAVAGLFGRDEIRRRIWQGFGDPLSHWRRDRGLTFILDTTEAA